MIVLNPNWKSKQKSSHLILSKVIERFSKKQSKNHILNLQLETLKPNELCITKCCTEMALL